LHTIRILNKKILVRGEKPEQMVEVSWEEDFSREITHTVSASYIKELLVSWENFIHLSWTAISSKASEDSGFYKQIQEFSRTWESLIFGGKTWIKSHHKSIRFITDIEWNGIPFEILPFTLDNRYKDSNQYPYLIDHVTLFRSVRMQKDSTTFPNKVDPTKKFLIWTPQQIEKSIQTSIDSERAKLETLLEENNINYDTLNHVGNSSNLFFKKLSNHIFLHYAGHTEKDHIPLKNGTRIYYEDILSLDLSNLEIVFWNSCYSGRQSTDIEGLVGKILGSGVKNFIGFLGPVETERAEKAGLIFWKNYLSSWDIQSSLSKTRKSLREIYGQGDLTAYLLALYSYSAPKTKNKGIASLSKKVLYSISIIFLLLALGLGILLIQRSNTSDITQDPIKKESKLVDDSIRLPNQSKEQKSPLPKLNCLKRRTNSRKRSKLSQIMIIKFKTSMQISIRKSFGKI
jgi:hypothetical protein